MLDRQTFQNKDLVLIVSPNCDPKKFNSNKYEAFMDALCEEREYQKEAIRETIKYLLSGEYESLKELAEENYHKNTKLQEKYSSFEDFVSHLQLPDKLSCSIEHATATGKSYVMYCIARIMLAEGAVDQVLLLCPSNTIEAELKEKFRSLSSDKTLIDLLPPDSKIVNPGIINASSTIKKGDICIENIHATYVNTKSAIEDSLIGKGKRTLILNDEAHHLMNPSDMALKKWKEFLLDSKYSFKYIVSLSGTCYIGDDYFTDVIHRFSLRDAIENKFVKLIHYVAEDSSGGEEEKLQKIYDNHIENKAIKYRKVKPLTVLITKNIAASKRLNDRLIDFLAKKEKISKNKAAEKVLIVTSANEHKRNIPILRRVDDIDNPIEWIASVSMLSEGWDVKNVFQIVPHEERAFNSKLLIAQVLGRGLRIPDIYKGSQPIVKVFNHDNWSGSIKHLVDEVLEIEKRIHSYPVTKKEDYNFELHQIDYDKVIEEIKVYTKEDEFELLKKGFITYSTQEKTIEKGTIYAEAISGGRYEKKTLIDHDMYSVEEVANDIFNRLYLFDQDAGTGYSEKWHKGKIKNIIMRSLDEITDKTGMVSKENRQKTVQAFGVIRRKDSTFPRIVPKTKEPYKKSTKEIKKNSIGVSALRRPDNTIFYDDYSLILGDEGDKKLLKEIIAMKEDGELIDLVRVENRYNFKTPLNIIFSSYKPERRFIQGLIKEQIANVIEAWIKSPDVGFYSIAYSWRKGEHPKQGSFNPDFFIKVITDILVIEIKDDKAYEGIVGDENKKKLEYANEHFNKLNGIQDEQKYYFKFLSPESYDLFFKSLRDRTYKDFISEIEAKLKG